MDILHLLVARAGSKGLPGKNLARIAGLSLLGYKARAAQRSRHCSRLILSTDGEDIQHEAARLGVEVPFTRPAGLAQDSSSSEDVVLHAIDWMEREEGRRYDAIMLLEPTTPFVRSDDLDRAVEMFSQLQARLVTGICEVGSPTAFCTPLGPDNSIAPIVERICKMPSYRRQDLPVEYKLNGAFYLFGWEDFKATKRRYHDAPRSHGVVMDRFHSVNIDTPEDLAFARFLAEQGYVDLQSWH